MLSSLDWQSLESCGSCERVLRLLRRDDFLIVSFADTNINPLGMKAREVTHLMEMIRFKMADGYSERQGRADERKNVWVYRPHPMLSRDMRFLFMDATADRMDSVAMVFIEQEPPF